MKKFLAMVLSVVMMATAMAVPTFAEATEPVPDPVADVTLTTDGYTLEDGATIYVGDTIELTFSVSNVTDGAAVEYYVAFNPSTMSLASATFNDEIVEPTVDTANYNLKYTGSASGSSTFHVVFTITKTWGAEFSNNFAGFEDSTVTVDGTGITVNDPEQGWDGVYYVAEPQIPDETPVISVRNAGGWVLASGATIIPNDLIKVIVEAYNNTESNARFVYEVSIPSGWTVRGCTIDTYAVEGYTVDGSTFKITSPNTVGDYGRETLQVDMYAGTTEGEVEFSASAGVEGNLLTAEFEDGETTRTFIVSAESEDGDTDEGETDTPEESTGNSTTVTDENINDTPHAYIPVIGKLDSDGDGEADDDDVVVDPYIDVRIYWTDMVFNYTYQWDKDNLVDIWYWENGKDNIKVENWSNVNIDAGISFAAADDYTDNDVVFTENEVDGATWNGAVLALVHGNQSTVEGEVIAPYGILDVSVADGVTMTTGDDAAKEVTLGYITVNVAIAGDAGNDDENEPTESGVVLTVNGEEYTGGTIDIVNNTETAVTVTVDGVEADYYYMEFYSNDGTNIANEASNTFTVDFSNLDPETDDEKSYVGETVRCDMYYGCTVDGNRIEDYVSVTLNIVAE